MVEERPILCELTDLRARAPSHEGVPAWKHLDASLRRRQPLIWVLEHLLEFGNSGCAVDREDLSSREIGGLVNTVVGVIKNRKDGYVA